MKAAGVHGYPSTGHEKISQWSPVIAANIYFIFFNAINKLILVSSQTYSKRYSAMMYLLFVLQASHFEAHTSTFLKLQSIATQSGYIDLWTLKDAYTSNITQRNV